MTDETIPDDHERDVHQFFGLSYAHYLVIPRSILQSMPGEWQRRFVALMTELGDELPYEYNMFNKELSYHVSTRDGKGRTAHDPLNDYRHCRKYTKDDFKESK